LPIVIANCKPGILLLGLSTASDSSSRDVSIGIHVNLNKNNEIIGQEQICENVVIPGKNADGNINTIRDDNVNTVETQVQSESNSDPQTDANGDMATLTPSARTMVMDESTLILKQVDQHASFPVTSTVEQFHDQCASGLQSVDESVPTEAQDSDNQQETVIFKPATTAHQTTFDDLQNIVGSEATHLVTGKAIVTAPSG